jgi:hypothetical protein
MALIVGTLLVGAGGCSQSLVGSSDLDQQKKDVMGSPAPPSVQAQIAADKAKAAAMTSQGYATAKPQKPQGQH